VSAETIDDDPDIALTTPWKPARNGILRAAPPAYEARQEALRARLKVVLGGRRREWSHEEQMEAESAYVRWRKGTGPEPSEEQMEARRAYRRAQKARLKADQGRRRKTTTSPNRVRKTRPTTLPDGTPIVFRGYEATALQDARRAYDAWCREGRPGFLPDDVMAAYRVHQQWRRYTARTTPTAPVPAPVEPVDPVWVDSRAADEITALAGEGWTLREIAEVRGVKPASVIRKLQQTGRVEVLAQLRRG
jgi:hypothetical protein